MGACCGFDVTVVTRSAPSWSAPSVECVIGDRDPMLGEGLRRLQGLTWDAVIDTSGFLMRVVRAAADALSKGVGSYMFRSGISMYGDTREEPLLGSSALATEQFLVAHHVAPFTELPRWWPSAAAGRRAVDPTRAVGMGLTWRPLEQTMRHVLDEPERVTPPGIGLSSEPEATLLDAWRRSTNTAQSSESQSS
jgi:hypothetical protein